MRSWSGFPGLSWHVRCVSDERTRLARLIVVLLVALAVGAVIALAPLVTIWGAIAIVVGVMLLGVALLVRAALSDGKLLAAMFGSEDAS